VKCKFDDIWLSDELAADGFQSDFAINGRQIVQEAQFVRSTVAGLFARGNRSVSVSFRVRRVFSSEEAAEVFAATHYGSLSAGPATLTCRCGTSSPTDVTFADAVLESVAIPKYIGLCVDVLYQFRAPAIAGTSTPLFVDVLVGEQAIPSGQDTVTFTGLAFASTPSFVGGVVVGPDGSDVIIGMIVDGSESTDGFQVNLNGVTPNGNYKFRYLYVL
jgi:hypothetical protein